MFSNLSMKARILAVFLPALGLTWACSVLIAVYGYNGINTLRNGTEALESRSIKRVADFGTLQKLLMKASISLRDIALSSNESQRTTIVEGRSKVLGELLTKVEELKKTATPDQADGFRRLEDSIGSVSVAIGQFDKEWKGRSAGSFSEEIRIQLSNLIWNVAVPLRGKVEQLMIEFSELELANQQKLAESAKQTYLETRNEIAAVSLLGSIVGVLSLLAAFAALRAVSARLANVAHALGGSSVSVEETSVTLSQSSTELASATTEEASSVAETAAAIEEMTATIARTLQNVTTALEVSDDGQQEAERGREVVGKMITAMNEIQNSNAKLDKMVKLIEEIQAKTRVINDIVFETRLLSFNASIEAARAGAQGRGFAVVAEEVGNLAVVSGKAADEIRVLLQSTTSEVNEIVRSTQDRINQGRSRAEECEQAFQSMGDTLSRVGQYVKGISAATHEQDSGVKQINRAMAQLDSVTQGNAASAEYLSAQASQLSDDSGQMTESVAELVKTVLGARGNTADERNSSSSTNPYTNTLGRSLGRAFGKQVTRNSGRESTRSRKVTSGLALKNRSKLDAGRSSDARANAPLESLDHASRDSNANSQDHLETVSRNDPRWKESA